MSLATRQEAVMSPARRTPIAVLGAGARTAAVTEAGAGALLHDLEARLRRGEGFAVATLNLDHLVKLGRDPAFGAAYAAQTHVTADGRPIVWLARLAGTPVGLVAGSDMTPVVSDLAARCHAPLALVGAREETLTAAAAALRARSPGLRIALSRSPSQDFDPESAEADEIIEAIAASGARLCLLALGAPRQERFAARALARLPGTGFIAIGAGLDFIAGSQRRAPAWVRALALEWFWRLAHDPRRLGKRYLDCFLILPGLTRAALKQRRGDD